MNSQKHTDTFKSFPFIVFPSRNLSSLCLKYNFKTTKPIMVLINNHHHNLLKRALRFLISMSLVSLLLFSSLYQNSSFNLVYHYFPIFSHTLERKYMFLICNGILVIIAQSSVSNNGSSSSEEVGNSKPLTANLYTSKSAATDQEVALDIYTDESLEDVDLITQEEQQEEENSVVVLTEEAQEEESESFLYVEEDENDAFFEEQQQEENSIEDLTEEVIEDEEEDDEEEAAVESNEELTSTEDMNRRFEEFIRKMKEEIRIEARSQLISV